MKKYLAESFGTLTLTLVVLLSFSSPGSLSTPILAALTVGLFCYGIGHISGCHINPAVTVGLWSIKKLSNKDAFGYVVGQFIGAGIAMLVFYYLNQGIRIEGVVSFYSLSVILAEFVGMFLYAFFIAAYANGRVPQSLFGIFIASALLFGIAAAVLFGSVGIINPAVALSMGFSNFAYLLAPLFGSVAGMYTYKYLDLVV